MYKTGRRTYALRDSYKRDRRQKSDLYIVQPTRSCMWYVANVLGEWARDHAVLLIRYSNLKQLTIAPNASKLHRYVDTLRTL